MDPPVANHRFRVERVTPDITLLVERHLDRFFESNVWHVRGRDRDLVVDTGNGIGDLRGELAPLADGRGVIAVATHAHFDHIGDCTRSTSAGVIRPTRTVSPGRSS
jgi:glyoxylase-like metal-dependent hydrolase (beta-lactamase superfamily II)